MNKFAVVVLLAVAACVASAGPITDDEEGYSQAASANDDKETSLLLGNEKLFSDFCHKSREYVINDIKNTVQGTSATLFKQFFGATSDIADQILSVEKSAVEALSAQIADPSASVSQGPLPEDQVEALIEQGKREIAAQADKSYGLLPGAKAAVSAMVSTVNSAFYVRLAQARSFLSANTLLQVVKENCNKVAKYEVDLAADLEETKRRIAEENHTPEIEKFLSTVRIESVRCATTKKVVSVNAFCELINVAGTPFFRMLGISSR